jgi:hypothetical protein
MSDIKEYEYGIVKTMIEAGKINRLEDIFPIVPKTTIARDLKIRPANFNEYIDNIGLFTINEIEALAGFIGIEYDVLYNILIQQHRFQKEAKKKEVKGSDADM